MAAQFGRPRVPQAGRPLTGDGPTGLPGRARTASGPGRGRSAVSDPPRQSNGSSILKERPLPQSAWIAAGEQGRLGRISRTSGRWTGTSLGGVGGAVTGPEPSAALEVRAVGPLVSDGVCQRKWPQPLRKVEPARPEQSHGPRDAILRGRSGSNVSPGRRRRSACKSSGRPDAVSNRHALAGRRRSQYPEGGHHGDVQGDDVERGEPLPARRRGGAGRARAFGKRLALLAGVIGRAHQS
jgi:hypothetical protein